MGHISDLRRPMMIRIEDLGEITLLNKAINAAKFSGLPENDELACDPTLAGLASIRTRKSSTRRRWRSCAG